MMNVSLRGSTQRVLSALVLLAWPVQALARDPAPAGAAAQVEATERAFARSMAERDLEAFASFVSEEAVFLSGATTLRGRDEVVAQWSHYFEGPEAPFSWEPSTVELLESGTLALSTGPVLDATGTPVATFTSIWRLEATGEWRIVFDRGNEVCGER